MEVAANISLMKQQSWTVARWRPLNLVDIYARYIELWFVTNSCSSISFRAGGPLHLNANIWSEYVWLSTFCSGNFEGEVSLVVQI